MELHYRILETMRGYVGFIASERGLRRVYLPLRSERALRTTIRRAEPDAVEAPQLMPELAADLVRFFAGEPVDFDVEFDWRGTSGFQRDVWQACRQIHYGETRTYGDLADRVGRPGAARAIGMAMGRNPCPIVVPCHRVLRSDGSLGGFSSPGGVDQKRELLDMEAQAAHGAATISA